MPHYNSKNYFKNKTSLFYLFYNKHNLEVKNTDRFPGCEWEEEKKKKSSHFTNKVKSTTGEKKVVKKR